MKICWDNLEHIRLNKNGNFKDIRKSRNNTYYYNDSCRYCNEPFLSKQKETITCSKECWKLTRTGENNPRYNDHRTYEELVGEKRAREWKKEKGEKLKGENHHNKNGNHWRWKENGKEKCDKSHEKIQQTKLERYGGSPHKGLTFEEYFGEEKANLIKNSISDSLKKYYSENGLNETISFGITGWFDSFFFRSGLELSFLIWGKENNKTIKSAENGDFSVSYINSNGERKNYFPDFFIVEDNEVIEIKPHNLLKDGNVGLKIEEAEKVYGDSYRVITEYELDALNAPYISKNEFKILYEKGEIQLTDWSLKELYGGKKDG